MPVATNKAGPEIPNLKPIYDYWEWQEKGNCYKIKDPDIFFLDYGVRTEKKKEAEDKAKAICVGCPVINECLDHALTVPENYGVWGGTTPEERLRMTEEQVKEIQTISLRIRKRVK